MATSEKRINGVAIVTVKGKLMGGRETLEVHEKVKELLENQVKKIVLDLSRVKWLNSQGLGMLTSCLTSTKNAGGQLRISGATEKVQSLFMMTKLITLFDTYETVEEALANF